MVENDHVLEDYAHQIEGNKDDTETEAKDDSSQEENYSNNNPNFYISVSPKIFRKNLFQMNKLQKEIFINKTSNTPIDFDPNLERNAPLYLDIPNLYKRKVKKEASKMNNKGNIKDANTQKRYKCIRKMTSEGPKYKYISRPATPKNFNPRPKSSNRYVFVGVGGHQNKRYQVYYA